MLVSDVVFILVFTRGVWKSRECRVWESISEYRHLGTGSAGVERGSVGGAHFSLTAFHVCFLLGFVFFCPTGTARFDDLLDYVLQ